MRSQQHKIITSGKTHTPQLCARSFTHFSASRKFVRDVPMQAQDFSLCIMAFRCRLKMNKTEVNSYINCSECAAQADHIHNNESVHGCSSVCVRVHPCVRQMPPKTENVRNKRVRSTGWKRCEAITRYTHSHKRWWTHFSFSFLLRVCKVLALGLDRVAVG